ncbi:MAG: DUF3052 domain-containing protein [Bacteroidota bacterium]
MRTAGYSGTPLAKKLEITSGNSILVLNSPKPYPEFFFDFPEGVQIQESPTKENFDFIHIFATRFVQLETYFKIAKAQLKKNGILWISWPKKSSKMATELDKFYILKYGLEKGLVDTKVAAIDENWSGHKFVYRLTDRK